MTTAFKSPIVVDTNVVMQRSKSDRYTPSDDRMAALEALAAKL
jgi:hypothetical protein